MCYKFSLLFECAKMRHVRCLRCYLGLFFYICFTILTLSFVKGASWMDKRWMDMPMHTDEYIKGVDSFLEFAFSNSAKGNKILCPCKACKNCCWRVSDVVRELLICEGFTEGYKTWLNHGEPSSSFFEND